MGVYGFRLDIFVIIWFMAMGMVNYLEAETGIFGHDASPRYEVEDIANWQGINVGSENQTASDFNEPRASPEESSFQFLDSFVYLYKAALFLMGTLFNATIGLHIFLRDTFGIPVTPWGLPIMILVNLVNFLGLIELWTKIKV